MLSLCTNLYEAQKRIEVLLSSYYSLLEAQAMARRIITYVADISLTQLLIDGKDTLLSDEWREKLVAIVEKLQAHTPLQYLLPDNSFGGIALDLSPDTLIPRPETEEMCYKIVQHYAQESPQRVADWGTGSGSIALYLAKAFPHARVYAVEKSEGALRIARSNFDHYAATYGAEKPIAIEADMLDRNSASLEALAPIDLIVSNPPYIPQSEIQEMMPHVVESEPHMALFVPDEAPLLFYEALLYWTLRVGDLERGVTLFCETHHRYAEACQELFCSSDYCRTACWMPDWSGKPRFVYAYFAK